MLGFVAIAVPLIIHVDTFGMSLLYSNELRKVNIEKCSRGIRAVHLKKSKLKYKMKGRRVRPKTRNMKSAL